VEKEGRGGREVREGRGDKGVKEIGSG